MQQTSNKLRSDIHIDSSIFALYVRQKKTTFEIQILPTVKSSLHIPISLLSLKKWEAMRRIIDGVRFFMRDWLMSPQKYFTMIC